MMKPIRLAVVMTHPVQYYAPWFRHIHQYCPEIDLTVVYATQPTPQQQGAEFNSSFRWDVPLLEGYDSQVIRQARPKDNVHSSSFLGLDVAEIGDAILDTRPDIVLVPGWHSITQVRAIKACRRAGIPLLYRGDSNLLGHSGSCKRSAWKIRTRQRLQQYTGYLSVGQRAREYLQEFGVREDRIFHCPHCVDNEYFAASAATHQTAAGITAARASFGLADSTFVLLFVGKVENKKHPLDLINAAADLGDDVSLLMVGNGPLLETCESEADRLGVQVVWAGFLNQSQLGAAYAVADCLVLPSDAGETWGLVVNEALATGLPCVVSDEVGCTPDLITPGYTGATYPLGDVPELAVAIENVRRRSLAGHDWGPACRSRAADHSFERAQEGLLSACRRFAPGHSGSNTPGDGHPVTLHLDPMPVETLYSSNY